MPTNCYRIDPSGRIDMVISEAQVPDPNGICFSPDYKKLYVASTGRGPGDVEGNLWISSNARNNVGYSGVTVWNPDGKLLGRIRLPEVTGNICFGGAKRHRLFMASSRSICAVYVSTQGAAPG